MKMNTDSLTANSNKALTSNIERYFFWNNLPWSAKVSHVSIVSDKEILLNNDWTSKLAM